jgi:fibronectin-binding autotransporter adhesin
MWTETHDRLHRGRGRASWRRVPSLTTRVAVSGVVTVLVTLSVTVLFGPVAEAATDSVTSCSGTASVAGSLPAVVAAAPSGTTVTFSPSLACPGNTITMAATIDMTTDLTLSGPGPNDLTLSAAKNVGLFVVGSGTTVAISGLTIAGIKNETAGAIANAGTLAVSNSTLSDNEIYGENVAGGAVSNTGTLSVTDSTLSDNLSQVGGGGAIGNDGGTVTVTDSTVSGNGADDGGGIDSSGGSVTVSDSTLSGNDATDGGAIDSDGATLIVTDSTLSGNSATDGGAIDNDFGGGTLTVSDSTLYQNSADDGFGGGINIGKDGGTGSITNSTLLDNRDIPNPTSGENLSSNGGALTVAATILSNPGGGGDCDGSTMVTDSGDNLIDDGDALGCGFTSPTDLSDVQAGLDPAGLENNGGPTQTIDLQPGSAALGAVKSASLCSTPDQRGLPRPSPCSIGALQTTVENVTNCGSSGTGSLSGTVAAASSGETIGFALSPPCSTITLTNPVDIDTILTVDGPGAGALAVSGGGAVGVFEVSSGASTLIRGLTVENGDATGGGFLNHGDLNLADDRVIDNDAGSNGAGGGVFNDGTANIVASTISGNDATDGGGIDNDGSLSVSDSTLSGNAGTDGGALFNDGAAGVTVSTVSGNTAADGGGIDIENGTLGVTSSTVSNNSASTGGGGIADNGGTVSLAGTIVAANATGGDCSGSMIDSGYNLDDDTSCGLSSLNHSLSGVDADLGPLQANGGPLATQAPSPTSPVLDQIPYGTTGNGLSLCPGTDERGVARPQSTRCDIGAVELALYAQGITSASSATATIGQFFSFTVIAPGSPIPAISEKGKLPKGLKLVDDKTGSATISGTPVKKPGTYTVTITALYRSRGGKVRSVQTFVLTLDAS